MSPPAGCQTGRVYNVHSPSLESYGRWQAHPPDAAVLDLLPVQGCCLSLSNHQAVVNACGGATRFTHVDEVWAEWRQKFWWRHV